MKPALPWAVKPENEPKVQKMAKNGYVTSIRAGWISLIRRVKMNRGDIVINTALERYKPIAAKKVQRRLCAECPDRKCERGERCNAYELLVKASAWSLASGKNN
jgi:hypothetical protein